VGREGQFTHNGRGASAAVRTCAQVRATPALHSRRPSGRGALANDELNGAQRRAWLLPGHSAKDGRCGCKRPGRLPGQIKPQKPEVITNALATASSRGGGPAPAASPIRFRAGKTPGRAGSGRSSRPRARSVRPAAHALRASGRRPPGREVGNLRAFAGTCPTVGLRNLMDHPARAGCFWSTPRVLKGLWGIHQGTGGLRPRGWMTTQGPAHLQPCAEAGGFRVGRSSTRGLFRPPDLPVARVLPGGLPRAGGLRTRARRAMTVTTSRWSTRQSRGRLKSSASHRDPRHRRCSTPIPVQTCVDIKTRSRSGFAGWARVNATRRAAGAKRNLARGGLQRPGDAESTPTTEMRDFIRSSVSQQGTTGSFFLLAGLKPARWAGRRRGSGEPATERGKPWSTRCCACRSLGGRASCGRFGDADAPAGRAGQLGPGGSRIAERRPPTSRRAGAPG